MTSVTGRSALKFPMRWCWAVKDVAIHISSNHSPSNRGQKPKRIELKEVEARIMNTCQL